MAAKKIQTRYTIAGTADLDAKIMSTKKYALAEADRRAEEHGVDITVTTQAGTVVYTAVAPAVETEAEIVSEAPAEHEIVIKEMREVPLSELSPMDRATFAPAAEDGPEGDEEDDTLNAISFRDLLTLIEGKGEAAGEAKAEWDRRMGVYDYFMRRPANERLVGPMMCVALEIGAERADGNMLDVDGRARYALIQRGLVDATYEEQGSKRVLVKAVINDEGRAAIWR